MTKFYLIRHCEAVGNKERIFQGTFDGEVSEFGKIQLDYLSLRMRNEPVDYIFSSSRKRALATAQAINKYKNVDIIIDDSVIEINAGAWEGKEFSTFPALFPEESYLWDNEPFNFVAPGGEKMIDVYNRMVNFVKEKSIEHKDKNIVIASHGCAIRNLMCWVKNKPFKELGDIEWYANTALNIFEVDSDLNPHLIIENDISHLPEEMRAIAKQNWSNGDKK